MIDGIFGLLVVFNSTVAGVLIGIVIAIIAESKQ